jgi:hypothetical protein
VPGSCALRTTNHRGLSRANVSSRSGALPASPLWLRAQSYRQRTLCGRRLQAPVKRLEAVEWHA